MAFLAGFGNTCIYCNEPVVGAFMGNAQCTGDIAPGTSKELMYYRIHHIGCHPTANRTKVTLVNVCYRPFDSTREHNQLFVIPSGLLMASIHMYLDAMANHVFEFGDDDKSTILSIMTLLTLPESAVKEAIDEFVILYNRQPSFFDFRPYKQKSTFVNSDNQEITHYYNLT